MEVTSGMATTWQKTRAALWARSHGRCEITGAALDYETFDAHHRRPKGMGGTDRADRDSLSNALALTPAIHNGGPQSVHGNPLWSRPRGYLVHKSTEWASMVPVLYRGRFWFMLGDTLGGGGLHPLPPGIAPPVTDEWDER